MNLKLKHYLLEKHYLSYGLIFLAVCIVYAKSLHFNFVNFDEDVFITNNLLVKTFNLSGLFKIHTKFRDYIPLTLTSYAIEHLFVGTKPFLYHLTNTLLHFFNCILIYILTLKILPSKKKLALLVTLVFAVHPLHVESVSWVAQRKDLLFSFFYLLGLYSYFIYCHLSADKKSERSIYYLTLIFFLFSLFSKLMAISFPIVLIFIDFYLGRRDKKLIILEKVPFFILAIFILILNLKARLTLNNISHDYNFLHSFSQGILSYCFYIYKSFFPFHLTAYYQQNLVNVSWPMISFTLSLFVFIFLVLRKRPELNKIILFSMELFFIILLPALKIIPFGTDFRYADRYMYLPLWGLTLAIFSIVDSFRAIQKLKLATLVLCVGMIIFLGQLSFKQTEIWKDHFTLWNDVYQKFPQTNKALINIGTDYLRENKYDLALQFFQKAQNNKSNDASLLINMSTLYRSRGDYQKALLLAEKSVSLYPHYAPVLYNMGFMQYTLKNYQLASLFFDRTTRSDPYYPHAHFQLGRSLLMQKKLHYSELAFLKALEFDLQSADVRNYLGLTYFMAGRPFLAQQEFEQAIKIRPNYQEAKINLERLNNSLRPTKKP